MDAPPEEEEAGDAPPPPAGSALARHGYGIARCDANLDLIERLREELTVSPKVNRNVPGYVEGAAPPSFPLWRESAKRFYAPRAFGLSRFGPPERDAVGAGDRQEVRHELRGYGDPRLVFPVLPGIAEIRNDGRDAAR